jgi:site-specific recombinase XerD
MKKRITLKRLFHHDKMRIGMFFNYDENLKDHVKSLPGAKFSSSNKCFYLDDSEENLKLIIRTLKDYADIDISQLTISAADKVSSENVDLKSGLKETEKAMNDFTEESEYEDSHEQVTITSTENGGSNDWYLYSIDNHVSYGPVQFRLSDKEKFLVIKFPGHYKPEWISEMKTYGSCRYDKRLKEWLLPLSDMICNSLADYFSRQGIKVDVIRQTVNKELRSERKNTGEEIRSRLLGEKSLEGLQLMKVYLTKKRYSSRTIEAYLAMLEFFFRFFNDKDPYQISEKEVSDFIYSFIIKLGYSAAYQNQMVSAIKMFYEISGTGSIIPRILERPRRGRALPKVFSKEEISRILNSTRNTKHKLLLWMIYSCGLRRSEVVNIKLSDLDRARGLLHIREGKGGIDRIVPVSDKVWPKIEDYIKSYMPSLYLFEGQNGDKYSVESVYNVFRQALDRAGIKKQVGVHSLRHSYATHLHENGLDIRYIQELLGHKSTKTTEIYTHVSRRNLIAVRSPIEDLDVV